MFALDLSDYDENIVYKIFLSSFQKKINLSENLFLLLYKPS